MASWKKTWRAWTSGEVVRLEELRLAGLTSTAIAEKLGRTVPSVRAKLVEIDVAYVGVRHLWLTILGGPHTIAGAAAKMGTKKGTVKQQKRRLRQLGFEVAKATR